MKIFITEQALIFINSNNENIKSLNFISNCLNFENKNEFRQNGILGKLCPSIKPVMYSMKNKIGLKHYVSDQKILIFCPPNDQNKMTDDYFEKELLISKEFKYN